MKISEEKRNAIIAYEGFLRRASNLYHPFMLKGSFVTHQYFPNPEDRIPNDLDWLYLNPLNKNIKDVSKVLDEWMIEVSEMHENDGVDFTSFRENAFWRKIDYAMRDDFPTVNTDLDCWVDGESLYPCKIDISYNLPVDVPPEPLFYTPLRGELFIIPNTVPLALQVSWKLHQTLVRPRFKDLFDLMHLVMHPTFTPEVFQQSLKALVKECATDNVHPGTLRYLLYNEWDKLFVDLRVDKVWDNWRHDKGPWETHIPLEDKAKNITDADKLPVGITEFIEQFKEAFMIAGFYDIDLKTIHRL